MRIDHSKLDGQKGLLRHSGGWEVKSPRKQNVDIYGRIFILGAVRGFAMFCGL